MKYNSKTQGFFETTLLTSLNSESLIGITSNELVFVWFKSDRNRLGIDNVVHDFNTNDIICLTEFNKIEIIDIKKAHVLKWNKNFYCIVNQDSEVGCRGILFYGSSEVPVIQLPKKDEELFETVWKMLELEMSSRDNLQEEMLQMMLKRILILSTRLYKEQSNLATLISDNVEIIKEYHFLVEQHFKEKHTVAEYAAMLSKSPKTLSNVFRKLDSKTPLQFIKDRKLLEAKRLLVYTDQLISEIGYDLGFTDVQSFSRFFKREEGVSPNEFQRKIALGKNKQHIRKNG